MKTKKTVVVSLSIACLICLMTYAKVTEVQGEDNPPQDVNGEGVCKPTSLSEVPVANLFAPISEPLSPWSVNQPFNPSKEHPDHWIDNGVHKTGHNGVDLGGALSGHGNPEKIRNNFAGVVVATSEGTGWGNSILIASRVSANSDEIITTSYHHLSERYVEITDETVACPSVSSYTLIGREGGSGEEWNSYGAHLHYTVRYWANLEHLNTWLSYGSNGSKVFGRAYPGHNKTAEFLGRHSPADDSNSESAYAYYGYLSPEPLVKNYFTDFMVPTPDHDWSEEYALNMRRYAITMGDWNGDFGTVQPVKRREAVRWLRIALGPEFSGFSPNGPIFEDLSPADPDYRYVQQMTTHPSTLAPVIDPDGFFDADVTLNRAEALKVIVLTFYPEAFNGFWLEWQDVVEEYGYTTEFWIFLTHWLGHDLYFQDVIPLNESWYAPYVYFGAASMWGKGTDYSIVALDSQVQLFDPEKGVARAEMAKWVVSGFEFVHGDWQTYDACANAECLYDEFCDPLSGECKVISDCIPNPDNDCAIGGGGPDPADCSNGVCDEDEDCITCPLDCGPCPPECGDNDCNGTETCETCPDDCGACPVGCPDNICGADESCEICPQDCGFCPPECGDDECNGDETCGTCPLDCGACPPECGDDLCNGLEDCGSCPLDCDPCEQCGDNQCNGNEDCNSCPQDCGNCVCADNEIDQQNCDPGTYCPPGTQERVCNNDSWGPWGTCESNLGLKFHGDGGEHCGAVVCLQISGNGNDSSLSATISKADNGAFGNDVNLTIFQPSSNISIQYGCLPTAGQTSYNFQISPDSFDISLGGTMWVNAQAFSPCFNGANYISANAAVSQCSSN